MRSTLFIGDARFAVVGALSQAVLRYATRNRIDAPRTIAQMRLSMILAPLRMKLRLYPVALERDCRDRMPVTARFHATVVDLWNDLQYGPWPPEGDPLNSFRITSHAHGFAALQGVEIVTWIRHNDHVSLNPSDAWAAARAVFTTLYGTDDVRAVDRAVDLFFDRLYPNP